MSMVALRQNTLGTAADALGVLLLVGALRVFLPSLITIYGDAGSTPPGQLGGFALLWFCAGLLAALLGRVVGPRTVRYTGAVLLAAGWLALAGTDGGQPQLYLSGVAVAGGIAYLTGGPADRAPVGLVTGLAAGTVLHAVLGTDDLVWRTGALAGAAQILLGLTFLATVLLSRPAGGHGVPARYLAAVGPALLLYGVLTGATARAGAGTLPAPVAVGLVTAAGVAAVLLAARPRLTGTPWLPALALPVLVALMFPTVTHGGVPGLAAWYGPFAQSLAALALAGCLGWAANRTPNDGPRPDPPHTPADSAGSATLRHGLAAGAGFLGCGGLLFGYYAAYDADLGFPNGILLLVAALWLAMATAPWRTGPWRTGPWRAASDGSDGSAPAARAGVLVPAVTLILAVAAGAGAALAVPGPGPGPAHIGGGRATASSAVRLVTYNIRMGFDLRGRFAVHRVADALRAQHPDVVLLNEVDRGWLLNGGHDDLALLAERLDLPYVFSPAADPVWGDAVLTRLPVRRVRAVPLPAEGPTGAQALGVVLDVGGRQLGVVATHFQPDGNRPALRQARAAAALLRQLGDRVVLAGDLNSLPGSPAIAVLRDAGLVTDRAPASYPADRPVKHIDHILTSSGVLSRDVVAVGTTASDHVPVAVTLEIR